MAHHLLYIKHGEKETMEETMKKKLLVLAIFAVLAAGLYAAGAQEDPFIENREKVTLTGTLQFTDGYPELNVGGKAWAVMAPGMMRQARAAKPGLKMTVEGYKVQPGPRALRPNLDHVLAEKITIDGKTYDLSANRYYGRGGMPHHRGGGRWDDRGYGRPGQGRWMDGPDRGRRTGPGGQGW